MTERVTVPLELLAPDRPGGRPLRRTGEPVTVGVPFPRAAVRDTRALRLVTPSGALWPVQAAALDRWADGSIRWMLLDFQAAVDLTPPEACRLEVSIAGNGASAPSRVVSAHMQEGTLLVDTGIAHFRLRPGAGFPFEEASVGGGSAIDPRRTRLVAQDHRGVVHRAMIERIRLEVTGPLRCVVACEGAIGAGRGLAEFFARLHFFAGSAAVRFALTVRNPRAAGHPGGHWDLGARGAIFLRDLTLHVHRASDAARVVQYTPEPGAPVETASTLELYQDSSGGPAWNGPVHVNRHRRVPAAFPGYRLWSERSERRGRRATPIVVLTDRDGGLAVTMPWFWQNCPKAVEAGPMHIALRLFPAQYGDVHEIQGGEWKTHTFVVAFGHDPIGDVPLEWVREPLFPRADPGWYCGTNAVPYLIPEGCDPNLEYMRLARAAIQGDDTFEHKRERIDGYGWRHFGDIYADHEAVHAAGRSLVSHYNNQYDALAGFAYQFLRSGDHQWWRYMNELASHVVDIDIYHTVHDKSAYSGGLFWHTSHYVDADTSTHRAYPLRGSQGGGPAAEHNYTTGLLQHHLLTGDLASRDAVLGLAQWVIDMDDGDRTVFRWLARQDTGLASGTASTAYHGPGRGAGNSINALLDAHRLSAEPRFLEKAEQLIRRCIHPDDDINGLELLDAERRWSYTVFLQALAKYLDYQAERGHIHEMYAYARDSLLHYASWMAANERPYLDRPERLEYPTETWAAQDMRKSEVFDFAALHADGYLRARLRERAEFFFRYSVEKLSSMSTRTLARPVVIMLTNGFRRAWFQRHPEAVAPRPGDGLGTPPRRSSFVPQKEIAKARGRRLAAVVGIPILGSVIYLLVR